MSKEANARLARSLQAIAAEWIAANTERVSQEYGDDECIGEAFTFCAKDAYMRALGVAPVPPMPPWLRGEYDRTFLERVEWGLPESGLPG